MKGDLRPLFYPASVALVGCEPLATQRLGSWPLHNLLLHGAPVEIWPVNSRYRQLEQLRCYRSVADLPGVPDLVLIMTGWPEAADALEQAEAIGAHAAIIFGSVDMASRNWLSAFSTESRMLLLGPSSNGTCHAGARIPCTAAPFAALPSIPTGAVSIVSQSGALISSLVARLRRNGLGLRLSCSVGEALDVGVGDCLEYLAGDPGTETVIVYLEALTDRESFLAGARRALDAGKHVVVLKAGRSAVGGDTVRSHTGALVGSFVAFSAMCEASGIVVADSVDQLTSLPAFLRAPRRPDGAQRSAGVGVVSGSGGIAALLADKLEAVGLPVPEVGSATAERIRAAVGAAAHRNPVDLAVHDRDRNRAAIIALAADPRISHIVFGSQAGPAEILGPVKEALAEAAASGIAVSAWSADGAGAENEEILAAAGIPVEPSIDVLVNALAKAVRRPAVPATDLIAARRRWRRDDDRTRWARDLVGQARPGGALPRDAAWRLLSVYGIPAVPEYPAATVDHACHAARHTLGYPVAAKLSDVTIPHRWRLGLVELGLSGDEAVRGAYDRLSRAAARLRAPDAEIVVQQMILDAREAIVGARVDVESGPCVFVGSGGILTEELNDIRVAPAPLDLAAATDLVATFRATRPDRPGWSRGTPNGVPRGRDRLAAILTALSDMAMELEDTLDVVEINPVLERPDGVHAVDVLVLRGRKEQIAAPSPSTPQREGDLASWTKSKYGI